MRKQHTILYIPGIGDHRARGQEWAIWLWRWYGVRSEMYRMWWREPRPFDEKLEGLLSRIDGYIAQGRDVSLVAASAGASAALNVFAARKDKIAGVVLICGKVYNAHHMQPSVTRDNPAFGEALDRLPEVLSSLTPEDRKRIMSAHPLSDRSVPIADTRINGALEQTIPVHGHVSGIAYGITVFAPKAIRFLKQQAQVLANNTR